jgi:hypothetical protein
MNIEEYRKLWQEAIHLCEIEPNKEEAESFVWGYYNKDSRFFSPMDDRKLLLTFVGLVVYEKKFQMKFGSTTPAAFCYQELLSRVNDKRIDKEFVYDVGDWAAEYSDNGYVPMGNYRGYGPRRYFSFWRENELRVASEKQAKQERIEKKRAEGKAKVEAAKRKHLERLDAIRQLRTKPVNEVVSIIEHSQKPVFYYIELIEEWLTAGLLNESQKEKIISWFPSSSTRHNNRLKKHLEKIVNQ